MIAERREPARLRKGKKIHRTIQNSWCTTAEGKVETEKPIKKLNERKGRIDVCVVSDGNLVAVIEVKDSNWDAMTDEAVKRNVQRQARQIWNYIESQLATGKEVSPGIVFPKRPSDPARANQIESMFGEAGIPVVWDND